MKRRLPILFAALLAVAFLSVPPRAAQGQGAGPPLVSTRATVTSTQLLALNATPQTVVAAPGAGRAIIFVGAVLYKPAGVAYGGIAAGEDLAFRYTNGSGTEVGDVETTGFLDQTTAQTRYCVPKTGALTGGVVSDITPVANTPLVLHLLVGEITTGDQPVRVRVFYRVVSTTL